MVITQEQYKDLRIKIKSAIVKAIGDDYNDIIYDFFINSVFGTGGYKDNIGDIMFDNDYNEETNKMDWDSWELNILETWEDIIKHNIKEEDTVHITINISNAMPEIHDIVEEFLKK